tara:strand:- start:203 stop:433 length:231 start_codon:yes stop_codon:yes gene_type:complete
MKVEILRSVMISGEPAEAGSILEIDDADAVTLLGLGKAVRFKEEAAAPKAAAKTAAKEQPSEEEAEKPKTTRRRTK